MFRATNLIGFGNRRSAAAVPLVMEGATATYHGNTSSFNVSLPSAPANGDLILIMICTRGVTGSCAVSGFTTLKEINSGTTPANEIGAATQLFGKISNGTEGTSIAGTRSSGIEVASTGARISGNRNGLTSSEVFVDTPVTGATASSFDPGSISPGWGSAEILWMNFIHWERQGSYTQSSGWTKDAQLVTDKNETRHFVQSLLSTASSIDPGTVTGDATYDWHNIPVAIRPQ